MSNFPVLSEDHSRFLNLLLTFFYKKKMHKNTLVFYDHCLPVKASEL